MNLGNSCTQYFFTLVPVLPPPPPVLWHLPPQPPEGLEEVEGQLVLILLLFVDTFSLGGVGEGEDVAHEGGARAGVAFLKKCLFLMCSRNLGIKFWLFSSPGHQDDLEGSVAAARSVVAAAAVYCLSRLVPPCTSLLLFLEFIGLF